MSIWDNIDDIEDDFDDEIPDEVLNDPNAEPRLLPDLDNMYKHYTYDDIVEDEK